MQGTRSLRGSARFQDHAGDYRWIPRGSALARAAGRGAARNDPKATAVTKTGNVQDASGMMESDLSLDFLRVVEQAATIELRDRTGRRTSPIRSPSRRCARDGVAAVDANMSSRGRARRAHAIHRREVGMATKGAPGTIRRWTSPSIARGDQPLREGSRTRSRARGLRRSGCCTRPTYT